VSGLSEQTHVIGTANVPGRDLNLPWPHLARDVSGAEAFFVLDELLLDQFALINVHGGAGKNGRLAGVLDFSTAIVNPVVAAVWPEEAEFVFPELACLDGTAHTGFDTGAVLRVDSLQPVSERLLGTELRSTGVVGLERARDDPMFEIEAAGPDLSGRVSGAKALLGFMEAIFFLGEISYINGEGEHAVRSAIGAGNEVRMNGEIPNRAVGLYNAEAITAMSCARGDRLLDCRVGAGTVVGVDIGKKLGHVVGAVFRRNAKEMMSLSAPDDFASVEIGLPDSEGARVGNELESLLEGSRPGCAGGYFVHDGPWAEDEPLTIS
jgi:hypothetical protein